MTDPQISVGNCCSCGYIGEMCIGRHVTKCPSCWRIMRTCGRCTAGASYETMRTVMALYTVFVASFMVLYLRYAPHASPLRLGTVSVVGIMLGCVSAIGVTAYRAKVGRMVPIHVWKRYDAMGAPVLVAETTQELSAAQARALAASSTIASMVPQNDEAPAPKGGQ